MGKGFGRIEKRRQQLEARKDQLRDLNERVPWEVLRSVLEQLPQKERKSNAGRKAIDPMVLFKLLILKQLYNLSNEAVEYQAHDRASFQRFLGLSAAAEIPDATTLDGFEQRLRQAGLMVMFGNVLDLWNERELERYLAALTHDLRTCIVPRL